MPEEKEVGVRKAVIEAEVQLRPALADLAKRFGGKASIQIELPEGDFGDDPWSGNLYKYSF